MAITLAAAGILMMTAGIRMTNGLFLSPINSSTGLGIVSLSLAMAIGQFVWGAVQPLAGALADRHGARPVLLGGVSLMVGGAVAIGGGCGRVRSVEVGGVFVAVVRHVQLS